MSSMAAFADVNRKTVSDAAIRHLCVLCSAPLDSFTISGWTIRAIAGMINAWLGDAVVEAIVHSLMEP